MQKHQQNCSLHFPHWKPNNNAAYYKTLCVFVSCIRETMFNALRNNRASDLSFYYLFNFTDDVFAVQTFDLLFNSCYKQ